MSPQPTTPTLLIAISFRSLLLCEGARQRDPFHEVGRRGAYGPQRPKVSRVSDRNGLRQDTAGRARARRAWRGAAAFGAPADPGQRQVRQDLPSGSPGAQAEARAAPPEEQAAEAPERDRHRHG